MVCNIKQFNGKFGCISCDHPGESSTVVKKRIYPYTTKVIKILQKSQFKKKYQLLICFLIKFVNRSDERFKQLVGSAVYSGQEVYGVKGSS